MLTKTVTIELPAFLYDESQRLTSLGLFRDFSDLVAAGLRRELKEAQELLTIEPDDWQTRLNALRAEIRKRQARNGKQAKATDEELLEALRATRRQVWEEEYRPRYNFSPRHK